MAQPEHTQEATIALENKIIYDMLKRIDEAAQSPSRINLIQEYSQFVQAVVTVHSSQLLQALQN